MDSGEFFDNGFRPNLLKRLNRRECGLIDLLGIDPEGRPAPTINGRRAAFWSGSQSILGEIPVLAVSVHPLDRLNIGRGSWYFGLMHGDDIATYPSPDIAYLEAAQYPADDPILALEGLAHIVLGEVPTEAVKHY